MRALILGGSGYVGKRLTRALLDAGHTVRACSRSARRLEALPPAAERVVIDAHDARAVEKACRDCDVLYYLIHSMERGVGDFAREDRLLARRVGKAARLAGVTRVVYLSGLGKGNLSPHLASRAAVAAELSTHVPTTTLRAAMIIGAGSASYEILRYLVERLPILVSPKWLRTRSQPIAIGDVIRILVAAPSQPPGMYDIGGPDITTYEELVRRYARSAGLWRLLLPVPFLSTRLSAYWIQLVTPLSAALAQPLAKSLSHECVCEPNSALRFGVQPLSCNEAMRRANPPFATTYARPFPGDPSWAGGTVHRLRGSIPATTRSQKRIRQLGRADWYGLIGLWHCRGLLDRLLGGPGFALHAQPLRVGALVDCWRIRKVTERRLELDFRMRIPGHATLTYDVGARVEQELRFYPQGLLGQALWYFFYPFHRFILRRALRGMR